MKNIRLTVKNYRCFDEANPLRLEIGPGFTAFVGPNNSGKSSGLRLFYELRGLWSAIRHQFVNLVSGNSQNVNYLGTFDPEEIFSDTGTSKRPLSVEIEILGLENIQESTITRVNCACDRDQPAAWKAGLDSTGTRAPTAVFNDGTQRPHLLNLDIHSRGRQLYDCAPLMEAMAALENSLYIGPFRNAINEGGGSYFDLTIGTGFISTWNTWKTGGSKFQNRAIEAITDNIRQIFEYERLEINSSEQLKTLQIAVNGKPYRLAELGAGLSQFIVVLGNAAIRNPALIFIDEPELNLHPSLQIDFLTSLASYTEHGIVYATHSIGLARTTAERIYSFQKTNAGSVVKPFEQITNYSEFVGELSFSTFKELGYDRILLVEGVTEVKTIQQFLRLLKKDHRIVILPLGGDQLASGNAEHELAELGRLSSHISAIVDSEREEAGADAALRRQEFAAICVKLGIEVCITERRAMENYFTDQAVKAALGETFSALGHYQLLKESPKPWGKRHNWKIARQMSLEELEGTDIGLFLKSL